MSRYSQTDYEQKNKHYLKQAESISQKERFGIFTQPLNLSIGDTYSKQKLQEKTRPEMKIKSTKSGNHGESVFQDPPYTTINDPYRDPHREQQEYVKEKAEKNPHFNNFRPTHNKKSLHGSSYGYQTETYPKQFNTRNQDGSVKTGPKQLIINKMKKGQGSTTTGHTFSTYEYVLDPYENRKINNTNDILDHKKKVISNRPFCGRSQSKQVFTPHHTVYGGDKNSQNTREKQTSVGVKRASHNSAFYGFNPSKNGFNKTFEKFTYMPEGPQEKQFRQTTTNHWRPNYNGTKSRPCTTGSSMRVVQSRRVF